MRRARWTDLCGDWGFAHDDADRGVRDGWQADAAPFTRTIVVPSRPNPSCPGSATRASTRWSGTAASFDAPALAGGRLLLHFGAVDYRARVWVNGAPCRRPRGRAAAFSADITARAPRRRPQVVVVRAEDQPTT